MKKVLFASTALVLSAGFAAAEVTLSGSAELGVRAAEFDNAPDVALQFHHDIAVTFTLSGETDGGLQFGGKIGLEEAQNGVATDVEDDYTVFVSGHFGKLTMGDTDGAFDWALQEVNLGKGSLADDETGHRGFNGNNRLDGEGDGQIARYEYSFGNVSIAASAEQITGVGPTAGDGVTYGLGAKFSFDVGGGKVNVGLGYQASNQPAGALEPDREIYGISVDGEFSGVKLAVNYSELDGEDNAENHFGLGAAYTFDAITVAANYGRYELVGGGEADGFGLSAAYDLGGGAVLKAGYGNGDDTMLGGKESYSFGLSMSF